MCGLVSVINKRGHGFSNDQRDVFSTLLFLDTLRGEDSTGVFSISNQGDVRGAKEASMGPIFLTTKEYDTIYKEAFSNGSALVGHNRKATRGNIVDENAHPFVVDDKIILVHNGTLFGDHKKHADVEVDSHAIAHVLSENGDVEKALNTINGAYALIWYNFEKGTLNFIRNTQRPLWWMETNDSYIWASEKAFLDFAAARHNLTVTQKPQLLQDDLLVTYTLSNRSWGVDHKEIKSTSYPVSTYYPSTTPFKQVATSHVRQQAHSFNPSGAMRVAERSMGSSTPLKTNDFEKRVAKGLDASYTVDDFQKIHHEYTYGQTVTCRVCDYLPVEGSKTDFYLYMTPINDPGPVIRLVLPKTTEETVMQFAVCEAVYRVSLRTKAWSAYEPGSKDGYLIFEAQDPELLYTGMNTEEACYAC